MLLGYLRDASGTGFERRKGEVEFADSHGPVSDPSNFVKFCDTPGCSMASEVGSVSTRAKAGKKYRKAKLRRMSILLG